MTSPKKKLSSSFPAEWNGNHGPSSSGQFVAKTQEEWKQLWEHAHSSQYPVPKAPKLPKGKMVIGIFAGQSSRGGQITIGTVDDDGTTAVVHHSFTPHGGGGMMATVMHEPWALKFVDKTDSDVVFTLTKNVSTPSPSKPSDLRNLGRRPV